METLKCNICGSNVVPVAGQSIGKCVSCGSRQAYDVTAAQENKTISNADIIDEIDSLLALYKIALDGGVWSKPDSIFDHVQNIEYELAPEPEIPIISENDNSPAALPDAQDEQQLTSTTNSKADTLLAKAAVYIQQNKKLSIIGASVVCAAIIFLIILSIFLNPNIKYKDSDALSNKNTHEASVGQDMDSNKSEEALQIAKLDNQYQNAVALMGEGKYDEAVSAFKALDGHKDSAEKISECHYIMGTTLMEKGATLQALNSFSEAGNYKDATAQSAALRKLYQKSLQTHNISAGRNHTAALKADGTIVTAGSNEFYQQDLGDDWTDLVSVSVGETHTVALKSNGTVVHAGAVNYGQRSATEWWDVVAIGAGRNHTIGLKSDGTVVSAGRGDYGQCDVWYWTDIVAISTGAYHTAGLKSDGTVVATGNNQHNQCDLSAWTDIIAIYAADNHTVGLKADGTVVAIGYNAYGQCDLSDWKDIVDIGIGSAFTVGLKSDGTTVTAGYSYGDLEEVSTWSDIVSISVGAYHIAGLKADGTIITVNYDNADQAAISEWKDIKLPE